MKRTGWMFSVVLAGFVFCSLSCSKKDNVYVNDQIGLSMSVPSNWRIESPLKIPKTMAAFFSEKYRLSSSFWTGRTRFTRRITGRFWTVLNSQLPKANGSS